MEGEDYLNNQENIEYDQNNEDNDNIDYERYKQEYDQNYGNYSETLKVKTNDFMGTDGIQGCVFNQNLENYEEENNEIMNKNQMINMNINMNENLDNNNMLNYDNQYRQNYEEMVEIQNEEIKEINNEQMGENLNINNIQNNIEIFEDAGNHIEEMNDNEDIYKEENHIY